MSLDRLQSDLVVHDAANWLHAPGLETNIHNILHLYSTAGKIAAQLELIHDHKDAPDVPIDPMLIADVVIEAIRFAENNGYNTQEITEMRMQQLRERAARSTS